MVLVIIDYNRTIYDPDEDDLMEGARALLEALKARGVQLVLVSKREGDRESRVQELGIRDYFEEVCFVEEKSAALFTALIEKYNANRCYVIGDYLYQEIRAGNRAGAKTIQFKQGRFAQLEPECADDVPNLVITRLYDALHHIPLDA